MALFDRDRTLEREEDFGADAATRALSVDRRRERLRRAGLRELARSTTSPSVRRCIRPPHGARADAHQPGDACSRSASAPASTCRSIRATARSPASTCRLDAREGARAHRREGARATSACSRWTPANLTFADNTFDIVYAPYLISVVPDPVAVAREMRRVCRPGGRIVILNHFRSANPLMSRIERAISPMTVHIGFKSDLDLPGVPRAGRPEAGLDREGERPADLVAGHLRQGLTQFSMV